MSWDFMDEHDFDESFHDTVGVSLRLAARFIGDIVSDVLMYL